MININIKINFVQTVVNFEYKNYLHTFNLLFLYFIFFIFCEMLLNFLDIMAAAILKYSVNLLV